MHPSELPEWLTAKDIMRHLQCGKSAAYRLMEAISACTAVGVRVRRDVYLSYLRSQTRLPKSKRRTRIKGDIGELA